MKTSVLIPSYNAAKTIEATLCSVFAQSLTPHEVIIVLDGGDDDTECRLERFKGKIRLLKQSNMGAACARNRLVAEAQGDIFAFVDADDLWHPNYLEVQCGLLQKYPNAVASFTGHVSFRGRDYIWGPAPTLGGGSGELIDSESFFIRYNVSTGIFGSMSFCCAPKSTFEKIGDEPFNNELRAAQDSYFCYELALLGPVAFDPSRLVAYRFTDGSNSENRIRSRGFWVLAFERLEQRYLRQPSKRLRAAFLRYYAARRRQYAKVLAGAGRIKEARLQLLKSIGNCKSPISVGKSVALLAMTALPRPLQPAWPSSLRRVGLGNN